MESVLLSLWIRGIIAARLEAVATNLSPGSPMQEAGHSFGRASIIWVTAELPDKLVTFERH
jgi:hypothetical protein